MMEEKKSSSQESKTRRKGINHGGMYLYEAYRLFRTQKDNALAKEIRFDRFRDIVLSFYDNMSEIILHGQEVAIPMNMGNIVVNKKRYSHKRPTDYDEYNRTGNFDLEYNSHTDGYVFSIIWRKSAPVFGIQNGYRFKASRTLGRALAKKLKNGDGYRYQSFNSKKISKHEIQ